VSIHIWLPVSNRRHWRLLTVVLSLCALLFTQSAVAAYACPAAAKAVQVAQMSEAGMPCAEEMSQGMDDEQPALCHAHCQSAQGALNHYQPASIATAMDFGPVLTLVTIPKREPSVDDVQAPLLRRSASPPLAIANCCFRI
jgi:hypothetical protein